MSSTQQANHRGDAFGMLVWTLPVRLIDVSRGGCRVEVARHLETGTNGQLEIRTDGVLHVDDVRVCRCRMQEGASRVYHAGVELLRTRRLSRRSLSLAMRRIIGEHRGADARTGRSNPRAGRGRNERESRPEAGACAGRRRWSCRLVGPTSFTRGMRPGYSPRRSIR